ncbi:hypothetical protein P4561_15675 [Priestia flexa]|uniref:hypothetical protein n=1 Tax=Priestia flexa TaxID=86664 RepID=UPI002E224B9C|nr:hypothetical protein [Priestia flexa]
MENRENIPQKPPQQNTGEVMLGCFIIMLIIGVVGTLVYFLVAGITDGISNWNEYDEDYEYIEESDDKDSDGDVDYDDVGKHLNDSLEEDVNDGDDW